MIQGTVHSTRPIRLQKQNGRDTGASSATEPGTTF